MTGPRDGRQSKGKAGVRRRQMVLGSIGAGLMLAGASTGPARAALNAPSSEADARAARRHDAARRFLETPFGRIAYIDQGRGPVALFLHGFPLSSFQWRGAMDRLADQRRCLAPDFLGLGRTEVAPGQAVTPAAQLAMLTAFLDGLGVGQVDLIANDSGGAVAQLFVAQHRERVRTLLLTNCDTEIDSPPAALAPVIDLARAGTYPDLWLAPWVKDTALARSATGLGGLCFSDPAHPTDAAIGQYLAPLVVSPARKALVNAYTLGLTPNPLAGVEARLRVCEVPVRIVWGAADPIFGPHNPLYLQQVLPRVEGFREIADGKLFFPEEYPDIVAMEARRLWSRSGRGA
jgi:haloalkane dehalogenase